MSVMIKECSDVLVQKFEEIATSQGKIEAKAYLILKYFIIGINLK